MKKVVLYGAVAIGAYLLYKKMNKPTPIGDDLLLPPSGKTVTASGQIVGGLGYLNRNIDVYDAAPYQYNMDPVNDFLPGTDGLGDLGFSLSKAVKSVTNAATSVVKAVAQAPVKVVQSVSSGLKTVGNVIVHPTMKNLTRLPSALLKTSTAAVSNAVFIPSTPRTATNPDGGTVYQDAEGNIISKEAYDALMKIAQDSLPKFAENYKGYSIWTMLKACAAPITVPGPPLPQTTPLPEPVPRPSPAPVVSAPPAVTITMNDRVKAGAAPYYGAPIIRDGKVGVMNRGNFIAFHGLNGLPGRNRGFRGLGEDCGGVLYLVNYNEGAGTVEAAFDTMADAKAAIDQVTAPPVVATLPAPTAPPAQIYQPPAPIAPPTPVYQPPAPAPSTYDAARAAFEQASIQTSADSDDYSSPASTALPETVTSVQTPSATFAPPPAANFAPPAASTKSGDSKVGLLVGGGVLAAIAAAVMNK